ncbi:MAG TPA: DUF6286 domain-containing protein [Acidimicrobiia bacterium]|nr:DUF6286 domain-containing protein [Acidimicrobiia bacterium]
MRIANRVLAVAAALVLVGGGLLVAAEIAWAALGHGPLLIPYNDWYGDARSNRWDASGPRSLFLILVLAGLVIVAMQLLRARPRSVSVPSRRGRAGVSRRTLEKAVARRVGEQGGILSARAAIDRRRVRIVAVARGAEGDLRSRVEDAARASLQHAGVDGNLAVAVRVERARS